MDLVEQHLWRDAWSAADPDLAAAHGVVAEGFGPVQVTAIRDVPDVHWVNLVLGAGFDGTAEDGSLAAAVEFADGLEVAYYVPVTPGAPGALAAEHWLSENGFERGYGWMKFRRPGSGAGLRPNPLPEPTSDGVAVREIDASDGLAFGRIVAAGFDLPEWSAAMFGTLPGRPSWRCYLAEVDGEPAGTGAIFVEGGMAEFGFGATLETARGRGCQTALLQRRIEDAEGAGCRTLFVETGERAEDRPSTSYRNILRAGFEEVYVRPNWQRPA